MEKTKAEKGMRILSSAGMTSILKYYSGETSTKKETLEKRPARDERVSQAISKRFVLTNVP